MVEKSGKLAYVLDELVERGCGCRTFLYGKINAGKLKATKRGNRTDQIFRLGWPRCRPSGRAPQRDLRCPGIASVCQVSASAKAGGLEHDQRRLDVSTCLKQRNWNVFASSLVPVGLKWSVKTGTP